MHYNQFKHSNGFVLGMLKYAADPAPAGNPWDGWEEKVLAWEPQKFAKQNANDMAMLEEKYGLTSKNRYFPQIQPAIRGTQYYKRLTAGGLVTEQMLDELKASGIVLPEGYTAQSLADGLAAYGSKKSKELPISRLPWSSDGRAVLSATKGALTGGEWFRDHLDVSPYEVEKPQTQAAAAGTASVPPVTQQKTAPVNNPVNKATMQPGKAVSSDMHANVPPAGR